MAVVAGGLLSSLARCSTHSNDPSCGQLAQWYSTGVGCLNTPAATLGEIYAIDASGASRLTEIGAFVQVTPASTAQLAGASAACVALLSAPSVVSAEPAETYTFQPMQFNGNATVSYDGIVNVHAQAAVGQSFEIATGAQVKTTLADPVRLIQCSDGALQALTDYWNALPPAQQSTTAFFIVTQVIETTLSTTAADNVSGGAGVQAASLDIQVGISNGCNQTVALTEPDAGGAPAFYDGQVFVFSPGGSLTLSGDSGACGQLLSLQYGGARSARQDFSLLERGEANG